MLVSSLAHCLSVLIFQLWGVQTLSPIPTCPVSCVCEETLLVNCASQSLPKAPSHIPATTTALDLSHNALHSLSPLGSGHMHLQGLQHLRVGNNSLESLSMCSGIQGIAGTRTLTRGKQRCVSWAPHLQSLSADRNQLKCLPRGLGNIKSLKVLQLSHNRISEIGRADLAGCAHLNELHLQYNLINTIHPEAFKDLQKLKVLDVSYNLLATIPVPAYLSLRNMNVLVDIFGNRWRCDCNLKTIRRWLSFDSELGKPAWEVVCFSPSHHAGKSLLYLEESDLACLEPVYSTPGLKKEVTVEEGMEFILSCSAANQDFMHTFWWTPQGQISDSQSFLHISNATERDAGLYVCISGYQEEHVSVFSLHVRKRAHDKRLRREAPIGSVELNSEDKDNIRRNVPSVRAVQQSHFALAVSLSVIITFIVAFVLGVVFRPFLDKCYKQIQNKRNSTPSPPNSPTSSTAQRPYVNEGYSDTDDQEQEVHEGPRVTFGGVTEIHEKGGVPYYVTLEGSRSGSNTDDTVLHKNTDRVLVENIELHKDVPRRKENKEMTSSISTESLNAESSKGMEFEYIPDPEDTIELEDKSISPASSISGEQQESQMPYEAKESTEQSVDSPTVSKYEEEDDEQASTGQRTTIPGFVTDPFPLNMSESKEESVDELDPDLWNDSGESFSFTEGSPRSSSRVSNVDAFGHPDIQKEMSVDEPRDRSSSWNSSKGEESEGGDTEYTVNPEDDEDLETQISYSENDDMDYDENKLSILEEDIHNENKKPGTGAQLRQDTITLDPTDIHLTYARGDSFDDEQFTDYKGRHPSSNSDYEDEPTPYHVHPVYRSSIQTTTPMEDVSGTSRCVEENAPKSPHQQESTSVTDRISESDESRASSYFDDSIFGKIDQAFDPIPQVKRYLHFTQSQSHPPIHTLPCSTEEEEIIPSEVEKTESKKFYSEDNFFAQSDASLAEAPKVKHYVQFSPSESQISSDSTPTASVKQVATPVVVSKRESPPDTISISYEGQSVSLEAMPKVQRYVQFRQSEPQTVNEPNITNIKEGSFFGQIPISFDEVPKVKHYVQFSPSESQISSDSTSVSQVSTPVVVSKTESPPDTIHISYEGQSVSLEAMPKAQRYVQFRQTEPQTVHEPNIPAIKEGSFFGQIPMSFDEVPKVKHHVQFSPSESQISSDSTPTASVNQVATPVVVSKRESPPDIISISYEGQSISLEAMTKVQRYVQFRQSEPQTVHEPNITNIHRGSFFGQIPISFDEVPNVKHYVQFSPSESQISSDSTPTALFNQVATPVVVLKRESPSDTISISYEGQSISLEAMPKAQRYVQFRQSEPQTVNEPNITNIKEGSFFGQIPISFDEVPNVKHYVQFSPSESQISSDSTPTALFNQVATPVVVLKRESPSDTISISYEGQSISLEAMPKVQRYVQFRQSEPQTVNEPNITNIKEGSFFGQIPISFDEVPNVKHYVQFSPSESQISSDSTPTTSVSQVSTPVVVSKTEFPPDTIHISYEGQSISLPEMPKAQRYVQFIKSEPQTVNEPNIPAIKEGSFFGQIPMSFDEVPEVKHYVQFSPSESQISSDSTPTALFNQVSTPVVVSKTESPPDTISISYEGQSVSLEAMPKVQRYVQFRQSEPQTVNEPNMTNIHRGSFFGQIPISFDEVPNVKHYVQFSPSESQISSDSTPKTSVSQVSTPVVVSKTESPPDTIHISYEGQSVSLPEMPKVQRYVQFRQSEPQTVNEPNIPAIRKGSFFGQIPISFDEVPEVKQYVQFSPSESQISSDSTPTASVKQVATPVVVSKRESPPDTISISYEGQSVSLEAMTKVQRYVQFRQSEPQTVNEPNITNIHRGSFFGQIPISFAEVPNVKRRILFSQLESHYQPSPEYRPSKKRYPPSEEQNTHEIKTTLVTLVTKPPEDFFVQIGAFLDGMPKVKRYMQFTQSEVFKTYNLPYCPLNLAAPTLQAGTEVKKNNSPFEDGDPVVDEDSFFGQLGVFFDGIPKVRRRIQFTERLSQHPESQSPSNYIQPAAAERSFFVPIGASSEIPKVRRYIRFSQSSSQPSSQYYDRQTARPVLTKPELISSTSSLADSKTNKEDNFFKKMDVSELPKVNRYIQFTKQHSKALKTFRVTDDVVKKTDLRGLELSRVDVKPLLTEDSFFAHIGTNLNSPPRVNRYIQFTQSEPYSSQQSQSPTEKMTEKERKTSSSSVDNDDALFDGIFESLNKIPKVKKSLLFTQSTYQKSNLTEVPQKVTPQLVTKTESVRSGSLPDNKEVLSKKQDNFFGQVGVSLYEVPKVKKYITFSQSKDYPPIVTPVLVTKTECNSIDSSFEEKQKTVMKEDAFSGQTGMPFDGVPKVKRYIQFTQTEPQPSAQSLLTKLQTRGSEDKVTPTINGDDFFGQTGSSFDELPRVKRHIRFTRAEPRLQPSMLHSLSNRTEKSIQTSTELKMKDLASEDYVAPAAGEHNFFGPIGTFYEIPKLKRYTRFSQSSTQPSSQHLNRQTDRPVLTKPELRTSLADSESNDEDTLFKKKDVSELPKVNRYVQFTQQPSTPRKSLNTHGVTDEKTELWGSDLSRVEITPPVNEDSFLGHLRTNLNSLPRVNRYIQFTQSEPHPSCQSQSSTEKMAKNAPIFTQSEYKNKTAANDKSSNTADTVFGSLDLSFIQLPKEKRHVYNMQSEPHRSSDGGFKLTTKKNEYFGQTDGVPRLIRYRQFRQSESLTQTSSPSISSQKWKTMDGESTDSKMFKTNLTSGTARDLSQIQDAPSGMKVRTETGRLHQLPEPKRSLYSSTPDVYEQPDHVSIEEEEEEEDEEVFRHTSSNSLPGDTKYVNTPGSSDRTASSTTESRTILESKLSSLHASSNESAGLPTRKLVIDPALQDVRQSIPDEPGASPGKDEAREYLRDSSLARQRQERRRLLFRQKRRAMDGFSLSSESFNSQESD
ncbi:uncharacterized protein LOC132843464 [Tachysurus vachellii]|uniref:uncharacterized protein LOC132843464 n=1 Tax=Tachysurus vachellii TaxID=175792 RepID=UPI00296A9DDA|nr:uncharacterized protein LOC132843464 [Tachysurus vachellii]